LRLTRQAHRVLCGALRGKAVQVPPLASELPYPARRAPRRFLLVVKGAARAWMCLWLGAALDGAGVPDVIAVLYIYSI
jgi:hypothetical protein